MSNRGDLFWRRREWHFDNKSDNFTEFGLEYGLFLLKFIRFWIKRVNLNLEINEWNFNRSIWIRKWFRHKFKWKVIRKRNRVITVRECDGNSENSSFYCARK